MEINDAINIINKYNIPEINKPLREITLAIQERDRYKQNFEKIIKKYKEILQIINQNKNIEISKKYWACDWS